MVEFLKSNINEQAKLDERFSLAILFFRTLPGMIDYTDCLDLIDKVLQCDSLSTSTVLLSVLVPIAKNHDDKVADVILEKLIISPTPLSFTLSVFCSLSDHIFPSHPFLGTCYFWEKIQEGIIHEDNLSRKRALYLMKRTLDTFSESKTKMEITNNQTDLLNLKNQSFRTQKKMWNEYFLIIETLEEKQVHLVKQVLGKVDALANLSSAVLSDEKPIHFTWTLSVYKRMFSHVNLTLVKWSLDHFLSSFQITKEIAEHPSFGRFICGPLLLALNETKLYMKEGDTLTGQDISHRLSTMISGAVAVMGDLTAKKLVQTFICGVTGQGWGPLPLLWVSSAVLGVGCKPCLGDEELEKIRHLIDHHMVYQEPLLRGAAQSFLLEAVTNLADPKRCSYLEVASLLYCFYSFKVLFPNTKLWEKVGKWVRSELFEGDITLVINHTMGILTKLKQNPTTHSTTLATTEKMVLLFVLFVNAGDQKSEEFSMLTKSLLENLTTTDRPYASSVNNLSPEEAVRMELYVISSMIAVTNVPKRRRGKDFLLYCELKQDQNIPEGAFHDSNEDKINALLKAVGSCINSSDVDAIFRADFYLNFLLQFVEDDLVDLALIEALLNNAKAVYISPETVPGLIPKVISLRIIRTLLRSKNLKDGVKRSTVSTVVAHVSSNNSFIKSLMSEEQRDLDIQNRDEQKLWGNISCDYQRDQWEILCFVLKQESVGFSEEVRLKLLESGFQTLEKGGKECLVPVLQAVKHLKIPNIHFIQTAKRFIFEYRKNEVFWAALEPFLEMCMDSLQTEPDAVVDVFKSMIDAAESSSGIFTKMMKTADKYLSNLLSMESKLWSIQVLVPIISQALLFGPVYRKDQRMITETNHYISELGADVPANFTEGSDHLIDSTVRVLGLKMVLEISKTAPVGAISELIMTILDSLQEIINIALGSRNRYYENSMVHRLNQRANQACLIFSPLFDSPSAVVLFEQQCSRLLDHNQQTSVRYLIEWSLIVLCTRHQILLPQLWEWLSKAALHRAGAVSSFITVVTHYACLEQSNKVFDLAIKEITPWCMAQHFGTRIVSQICFRKLWDACENKGDMAILQKYQVLRDCLNRSVYQGNAEKTAEKLSEDFYLSDFDPQIHFSLSDILYELPRLCGMSSEECISITLLQKHLQYMSIPVCSSSDTLSKCVPSKLVNKDPLTNQEYGESENIQKKITPWKTMFTDSENQGKLSGKKETAYPDLVVVASLIDRAPNLGGLCRTCEIFGVGTYVVPSKSVLKDKDFTAVSVTAENWVPIEEACLTVLPDFLKEKQKQGWTIIGVEQTQESRPLQEFNFPEKCVLLLGSEKEGIPVELLQQVDICIEIPQKGLIRSFNVHVTGALVLWEYVRQHLNKKPL